MRSIGFFVGGIALSLLAAGCPQRIGTDGVRQVAFTRDVVAPSPVTSSVYVVVTSNAAQGQVYTAPAPDQPWSGIVLPALAVANRVQVDPTTPTTLYVLGSDAAGSDLVLRSQDAGATWAQLSSGLPAPSSNWHVTFLEPDAVVPGELWLGYATQGAPSNPLLFVSTDRGTTWSAPGTGIAGSSVVSIAFDCSDSLTKLVATDAGISRTTDGGATWQDFGAGLPPPSSEPVLALIGDPSISGRTYALMSEALFVRTAGISSWSEVPSVRSLGFSPVSGVGAAAFAVDPSNPSRLYLGITRGPNQQFGPSGIWVSEDGGATFTSRPAGPQMAIFRFLVDRNNPNVVLAATENGLARSTDSGASWTVLNSQGLPTFSVYPGL